MPSGWRRCHWEWVKSCVHFDQPAQSATYIDYVHEVEHAAARIQRLEPNSACITVLSTDWQTSAA
jgi:hypothetical protein